RTCGVRPRMPRSPRPRRFGTEPARRAATRFQPSRERPMENATYIALSRQTALMRQMDIVANNIANADTSGFKREQVLFEEYLAQRSADAPLSYVMDVAVVRDTQPGHMEIAGREFDLAIRGDGYFVVETPAGLRYTRGGAFQLNGDRE